MISISDILYVYLDDGVSVVSYFFFFKQKTAYETRISDWSSDVCSSDLGPARGGTAKRNFGGSDDDDASNHGCIGYRWRRHAAGFGPGGVRRRHEIGRASGRERVWQYVKIQVVDGPVKKKYTAYTQS